MFYSIEERQHVSIFALTMLHFRPRVLRRCNKILHACRNVLHLPSSCFLKCNTWRHLFCFCCLYLLRKLQPFWRGILRKILACFTSREGFVTSEEVFRGRFLLVLPSVRAPLLQLRYLSSKQHRDKLHASVITSTNPNLTN